MSFCVAHLYDVPSGEVILQHCLSAIAPRLLVNGHAVLPFVLEQVPRVVAVSAGVVATMFADGTISPAVISNYGVLHRTEKKKSPRSNTKLSDRALKHVEQ